MLRLKIGAGSCNSATSQNCHHRVWTSAPSHPKGRAGLTPTMLIVSPIAQDWGFSQVLYVAHQFTGQLPLIRLLTCYCSDCVRFPLNDRLVPAGMRAFRLFTLDYLTLDDHGQSINSL